MIAVIVIAVALRVATVNLFVSKQPRSSRRGLGWRSSGLIVVLERHAHLGAIGGDLVIDDVHVELNDLGDAEVLRIAGRLV